MPSSKRTKTVAPYGFWESPISTDLLLQKATGLSEVLVPANSETGQEVAWVELRMSESGRYALMHSSDLSSEKATDITSGKYSSRSGVHEYGGGAAASLADGSFIFSDYNPKSFDVLRAKRDEEPQVVSPENAAIRYADFGPHPAEADLCLAVQEDHTDDTPSTVVNSIVLLDLSSKSAKVHTLLQGRKADEETDANGPQKRDFYTFARFSPNGKYVCWVSWNHPSMPWWDTQLWVAKLDRSDPEAPKLVSPTQIKVPGSEARKQQVLQQPVWAIPANSKDDAAKLFFACDATGYLNLYFATVACESNDHGISVSSPELILPEPVKHDFVGPAWTCNNSDYIALSPDLLIVSYSEGAKENLGLINLRRPRLIPLKSPFVSVSQLRRLTSTSFALLATCPDEPNSLVRIDLRGLAANNYVVQPSNITVIKRSSTLISDGVIERAYLSEAREIDFPTTLANGKPSVAHAIIFEPKNKEFTGPKGKAPPCVFMIHGGPSASAGMGFNLQTQFWTSRGFMVCFVNYGGSTGYGREYLERLTGEWGVTDVTDCVAAAKFLGSQASLDPRPFGSLTAEEQSKVRKQLEADEREGVVVEEELCGGGIKVTLKNTTPAWSWMDLIVAGVSAGVGAISVRFASNVMHNYSHCIPALMRPTTAFGQNAVKLGLATLSLLPFVASKLGRVVSESVSILPGIGVQLGITRGLTLSANRKWVLERTSQRLIPQDRVVDIYVGEGYRHFSVVDYLAVVTSVSGGASTEPLFSRLLPRLSTVQRIYATLHAHLGVNASKSRAFSGAIRAKPRSSLADASALLISGGSAGGYTVLASLCFYPHIFTGGVSRYGVSSLSLLAAESHKFESRYPFQLIGGTPTLRPDLYHDRSPIFYATNIKAPILLLQGSDDKVVPKSQADQFVQQLKNGGGKEGKDWRYKVYEGEGHGFRRAENVKDSLDEELRWWQNRCLRP